MDILCGPVRPMFFSSSRLEQERLQSSQLERLQSLAATLTTEKSSTIKQSTQSTPMSKTEQDAAIVKSLRQNYEHFYDSSETPKNAYKMLSSLRRVHNYYVTSENFLKKSATEKCAKKYRHSSCATMRDAKECARIGKSLGKK